MFQSVLTVVRVASTKPVLVMSVTYQSYMSPLSLSSTIVPSEELYTVPNTPYHWERYSYNLLWFDTYIWTVVFSYLILKLCAISINTLVHNGLHIGCVTTKLSFCIKRHIMVV